MTEQSTALAVREKGYLFSQEQIDQLTPAIIKQYFENPDGPAFTELDCKVASSTCKYLRANPYLRDVHIIKYDKRRPIAVIEGKGFLFKRADGFPQFKGLKGGVICCVGSELVYHDGAFYNATKGGEILLGAWAEVYRNDRDLPARIEVMLTEYDQKQAQWNQRKATMIVKVAKSQALREAFPQEFDGLYAAEEFGINPDDLPTEPIVVNPEPETAEPERVDPPPDDDIEDVEYVEDAASVEPELDDTAPPSPDDDEQPAEYKRATEHRVKQITELYAALPFDEPERTERIVLLQQECGMDVFYERPEDVPQEFAMSFVELLKNNAAPDALPEWARKKQEPPPRRSAGGQQGTVTCSNDGCSRWCTAKTEKYSMDEWGRPICWQCQRDGNTP